jgi:multiple sugar transport system permease protein
MNKRNIVIAVIMIILGLIMVFPIYLLVMSSLRLPSQVFQTTLFPTRITLDNFKQVFHSELLNSIKVSFIVSVTVTVVALLFHSMSGYALARLEFPGKTFVFGWMISTLMVPFAVIMIPLFMITKQLGMTNSYAGLIIPALFNAYGIFLFRQFYKEFPKELEESAFMEGCSYAGTFFRIVLPMSKPVIVPLTIAFFLATWNSYLWPIIVNQKKDLWVVQVALANMVGSGYSTPWNIVLASAVVAAVPTFILFFVMQKHLVEGIKMTGIK